MRNPLKMIISLGAMGYLLGICEYSASILWVFYGYLGLVEEYVWGLGIVRIWGGRGLFVNYIQFLVYFY
jgi:hypothetical protein